MKRWNKIIFFLGMVMLFLIAGCSSTSRGIEEIIKSNKIVVALNAEFPPFEYKDGSEFLGIDIDIIEGYADYIGVECIINDMDFDATFLSVYSSKADLAISGITVNDKREKSFTFSNSYYSSSQIVIVNSNSNYLKCSSDAELLKMLSDTSARIGVQRGTVGEYYSAGDSSWGFEGIPNTKTISYDNGALACKDLSDGKIDAVILDKAPAELIAKKYSNLDVLDYILTEEEYAIAVQLENISLVESLNKYIDIIKSNGVLDSIVVKYYDNN